MPITPQIACMTCSSASSTTQNAGTSDQILASTGSGTDWMDTLAGGVGDITYVNAGAGLTGEDSSGDVTLAVEESLSLSASLIDSAVIEATNSDSGGMYSSGIKDVHSVTNSSGELGFSITSVRGNSTDAYEVIGTSTNGTGGYFSSISGYSLVVENGNTGIGTRYPEAKLHLKANTPMSRIEESDQSNKKWHIGVYDFGFVISESGVSDRLYVDEGGNVGIGTTTPARKLHVSNVMRLQPRAAVPSSASEGYMYMDRTIHKLMVYDGSTWQACW